MKNISFFVRLLLLLAGCISATAQPLIIRQPANQSVSLGAQASFSVTAFSTNVVSYQWHLNGQAITDATNRTLSLTNVTMVVAGNYAAAVSDVIGAVTSVVARLEVDPTFTKVTTGAIVIDRGDHEGMAWIDYDGDGRLDLFSGTGSGGPANFVYHNNGDGTFTRKLAVALGSITQVGGEDCAWGDYDNDGFLDVFTTADSVNSSLHHNNGNGMFTRITTGPMLATDTRHRACAWADFDGDGYIDLFVTTQNKLYRNNGNGTFTAVTNVPFILSATSTACVWTDYNDDGRPDLWASCGLDSQNYLYRNEGNGKFTRVTTAQAHGVIGNPANSGVWGDYNNDGYPDLWTTAQFGQTGQHLYRNNGDGTFTEVATLSHLTEQPQSISGAWADYDNDGYLDLFVSSNPANLLYRNNGDGTFTRVKSGSIISDGAIYQEDYSCAWGDYDNDGFLDLVVGSIDGGNPAPSFLYRNNGNSNGWIKVSCVGTASNRAGIGAKVRVRATIAGKTFWQLREISGGGGYGGQNLIAHFGLGDAAMVDTLRIEWPSGAVQELANVAKNQMLTVTEPPRLQATGAGQFRVSSWQGQQFRVEISANLADWSPIGVVTNTSGAALFDDASVSGAAQRFYRVVAKSR